jgi:WD40 repeat protein
MCYSQYWVIDAFDECRNTGPRMRQTLGALFSKIESILRLKICISSRPTIDTVQLFDSLQTTTVHVNHESNADDIRRYVENSRSLLPVKDEETRKELAEKIIERACGCFLWVRLVIAKLEDCYFSEEIEAALENVPNELDEIYSQNLEAMSSDLQSGKPIPPKSRLAKTILTWTICATRPLSVEELRSAIKIELESDVIRDLGASIASLCGNLVYVDKQGLVQIVHQTARAFLTDDGLESYFRIKPGEGHMQLATACLKCLCSEEMKFQRRHRRSMASARGVARSPISQYAIRAFTEHLARAESSSDTLFRQLTTFLKTNVLVWIEELAYTRDLSRLISAATHFKSYLARRSKHAPPLEDDIRMWSRDLPRIITEFGRNLLDHPIGIHRLIPPFCPGSSIIHSQFASQSSGIQLIGLTNTHWDDRICCHYYKDQMTKSIASQDQRYAVGLANGIIRLYDASTCEQAMELDHGEPVRSLVFGPVAKTLASSGFKNVVVWDLTTQSQHLRISLDSTPLAVSFNESEPFVNIAARSTEISVWAFLSKTKVSSRFPRSPPETADHLGFERVPTAIEISTESNMIAVYYRSRPLLIYDLQSLDLLGACQNVAAGSSSHITHTPITSIVFNPRPEMQRLAVAYWDGDIALFDTDSFRVICYTKSESQTLTASADGRTLAGGNSSGRIEIFDFGTLEKIYSAVPSSDGVTTMAFTSDSRRLLDIRAYQVNVWEPFVLTRNFVDDNSSEPSDAIGIAMEDLHISRYDDSEAIITAVICCYAGTRAICGKTNGAVDMYDVTNEHKSCWHLYKSGAMEVSVLEWNEQHRLVASGDMSGRFQVVRLSADSTQRTRATKLIIKKQLDQGESINQLLISASGIQILVSSSQADQVWCLATGKLLKRYSYANRASWKWFLHPSDPAGVIKLQDAHVQRYQWEQLQPLSGLVQIRDNSDATATIDIEHAILIKYNGMVALKVLIYKAAESGTKSHNIKNARLYTIALPTLQSGHESLVATSIFQDQFVSTKADIDLLIGTVITVLGGHILIFMSNTGWVCSVDLNIPFPHDSFQRHFFVPFAWLSTSVRLLIKVSDRGDVLFVHGQEIAVVRNGFEELDVVQLGVGTETKRASADDSTSGLKPPGTSSLAGWNWSTA